MDFEAILQEWLASALLYAAKLIASVVIFFLALMGVGF